MRTKTAPLGFVTGGQLSPRRVNENRRHMASIVDDQASQRYSHFTLRFPFHRTAGASYDETHGNDVVQYWFKPPVRVTIERARLRFYGAANAATDSIDIDLRDGSGVVEDAWLTVTPGTSDAEANDFNGKRIELDADTDYYFRMVSASSSWDSRNSWLEIDFRGDRWNAAGTESVPSYDPTDLQASDIRNATTWNTETGLVDTAAADLQQASFPRCSLFVAHSIANTMSSGQYTWPIPSVDSDDIAHHVGLMRAAIGFSSAPGGNAGGSWILKNAAGTTQASVALATTGTSDTDDAADQADISGSGDSPTTVADDFSIEFDHDTGTDTIDKAYCYLWAYEPAPTLSYSPSTATKDSSYTTSPTSTGTIETYELVAGTLPTGLTLNTTTGDIDGTPTVEETQTGLQVKGYGPGGTVTSASFSIEVSLGGFMGGNVAYDSMEEAVIDMMTAADTGAPTANEGTLTINGNAAGAYSYSKTTGNVTWTSGTTVSDYIATGNEDAEHKFLLIDGDLTIDATGTLEPPERCLGLWIGVTGDLTVTGALRSKGADHGAGAVTAVEVRLAADGSVVIPAAGGGGASGAGGGGSWVAGNAGSAGTGGGMGGGGSGAGNSNIASLGGAAGTAFSGGSASGGNADGSGDGTYTLTAPDTEGGAGGDADAYHPAGANHVGGGGAGNPGGVYREFNGTGSGTDGEDRTGGALGFWVAGTYGGAGTVDSDGGAGGDGGDGATIRGAGGAGSGGGVVYGDVGTDSGPTPTASGGAGGTGTGSTEGHDGGVGGAGSVNVSSGFGGF